MFGLKIGGQTMNPLKRFLGDTSSEKFTAYDTADEAKSTYLCLDMMM